MEKFRKKIKELHKKHLGMIGASSNVMQLINKAVEIGLEWKEKEIKERFPTYDWFYQECDGKYRFAFPYLVTGKPKLHTDTEYMRVELWTELFKEPYALGEHDLPRNTILCLSDDRLDRARITGFTKDGYQTTRGFMSFREAHSYPVNNKPLW